jgi:hypothetical protein
LVLGYVTQCVGYLAVGLALVAGAPVVVVGIAAAASNVTLTFTRPTHHALLPKISRTTGDLTVGNAASGSLQALATFLGPLASGLVLAAWGADGVLLTVAAALRCACFSSPAWPPPHPAGPSSGEGAALARATT